MNQNMNYSEKDGTLATKEEERAALAKIKKIIEGLGEGSYLDWAFDGILDLASENIDTDSAFSMKEARDSAVMALKKTQKKYREEDQAKDNEITELNKRVEALETRRDQLLTELDEWSNYVAKLHNEGDKIEKERDELKQENLELKAKLYDLMTK